MKKSFTLYVFIHLLLVASVIVYAQRLITKQLVHTQLQESAVSNMAHALSTCSGLIHDADAFSACVRKISPDSIDGHLTEFFIPCDVSNLPLEPSQIQLCDMTRRVNADWRDIETSHPQKNQYATVDIDQQQIHMVRLADQDHPIRFLLRDSSVEHLLDLLWKLRDRNLIYMMPTFLLMIGLMGWYVVGVVLQPIRKIEQAVSTLTAQNLNQTIGVPTPFVEFQTFVSVFEDLRKRLADSFIKARRFACLA